jgi:hypothetical protein
VQVQVHCGGRGGGVNRAGWRGGGVNRAGWEGGVNRVAIRSIPAYSVKVSSERECW